MNAKRPRRGRPAFEPSAKDRRAVASMVGHGIPAEEIAAVLGIDPKTLRKHFAREIAVGSIEANSKVAKNLHRIACSSMPQAAVAGMFWLKARAGWNDRPSTDGAEKGKKERKKDAAKKAATGKLAPGRPPLKLVKG